MNTFRETLKSNIVAFLAAAVIAVLTVFSDKIVGDIKFAMNKADTRIAHYETLATDISNYTFNAETVTEYYNRGWTGKTAVDSIVPSYNEAIVNLRKKEYSTLATLDKFWKKEDVDRFKDLMKTVREIDLQIHNLTPEAEAATNDISNTRKADPAITKPITDKLNMLVPELQTKVNLFLTQLH